MTTGLTGLPDITVNGGLQGDTIDASALPTGLTSVVINGNEGDDTITGSQGPDTLTGGPDTDNINGSGGADLILWNEGDGNDSIQGGSGTDEVRVTASSAPEDFSISTKWNSVPSTADYRAGIHA